MIEILMKAPLFEHVSSDAIFGFLEKIPYRVESYRVHDVVALQGTPCNHLMVVLKGLLQGQMVNDAGKLIVIEELMYATVEANGKITQLFIFLFIMIISQYFFLRTLKIEYLYPERNEKKVFKSFGSLY